MRTIVRLTIIAAVALVAAASSTDAQTVLGNRFDFKMKAPYPETARLTVKAQETLSPELITGDPATDGAVLQVILNGATPGSVTIVLPPGERWRGYSPPSPDYKGAWKYSESAFDRTTPVKGLTYARSSTGKFKLQLSMDGRYVPLDLYPPNPGTFAGVVLTIPNGPVYCVNFGGVAGGTFSRNDVNSLRIAKPTAQATCASGSAVCGDGVVDAPAETCDVSNDAACPGLCGANGLACLCPFCGDATIDPGEACDTNGSPGSCTGGCSYACTCTVCGDGVVQPPGEDCEPDSGIECYEGGSCWAPGSPNECTCPYCGDGIIDTPTEQCDGGDDGLCPGLCQSGCLCPVCGNDEVEPGEECDGSSGSCDTGECQADCTCTVCGDGVVEAPEQCEAADESACPGLCNVDGCYCSVCGNDAQETGEQCDGADDGACPGSCQVDCTCP